MAPAKDLGTVAFIKVKVEYLDNRGAVYVSEWRLNPYYVRHTKPLIHKGRKPRK